MWLSFPTSNNLSKSNNRYLKLNKGPDNKNKHKINTPFPHEPKVGFHETETENRAADRERKSSRIRVVLCVRECLKFYYNINRERNIERERGGSVIRFCGG